MKQVKLSILMKLVFLELILSIFLLNLPDGFVKICEFYKNFLIKLFWKTSRPMLFDHFYRYFEFHFINLLFMIYSIFWLSLYMIFICFITTRQIILLESFLMFSLTNYWLKSWLKCSSNGPVALLTLYVN